MQAPAQLMDVNSAKSPENLQHAENLLNARKVTQKMQQKQDEWCNRLFLEEFEELNEENPIYAAD